MFKKLIIIEGKKHIELESKNEVYNYLFGDNYINLSSKEKKDILEKNALFRTHNLNIKVTKEPSYKDFCIYDEMTYIYSLLKFNYINLLENKESNIFTDNLDKSKLSGNYIIVNTFAKELLKKYIQEVVNGK